MPTGSPAEHQKELGTGPTETRDGSVQHQAAGRPTRPSRLKDDRRGKAEPRSRHPFSVSAMRMEASDRPKGSRSGGNAWNKPVALSTLNTMSHPTIARVERGRRRVDLLGTPPSNSSAHVGPRPPGISRDHCSTRDQASRSKKGIVRGRGNWPRPRPVLKPPFKQERGTRKTNPRKHLAGGGW